jgi:hypothetical protein
VWRYRLGAHQHHQLEHLVHLNVFVAQVEIDAATDMERLRWRIGGSCYHPAPSQFRLCLAIDAHLGWHVLCVFARGERRVGVIMSATLALQP